MIAADGRSSRSSSGSAPALIVYTHVGYPLLLRAARARCGAAADPRPELEPSCPGLADRRRLRRGGGDRGEGRQRARARLPARAARGDRRLRRLRRPHRRARPRGRGRPRAGAAARRQGRRPERRRRARRAASSLAFSRRQRAWAPDALRQLVAPFADPAVGYVCGQVALHRPRAAATRRALYWRYEMAVRAHGVRRWPGSPPATAAIYAVRARGLHRRSTPARSHDLSLPVRARQARLALGLRARGAGRGADGRRRSRASSPASGG